jgi:hypothetical protein
LGRTLHTLRGVVVITVEPVAARRRRLASVHESKQNKTECGEFLHALVPSVRRSLYTVGVRGGPAGAEVVRTHNVTLLGHQAKNAKTCRRSREHSVQKFKTLSKKLRACVG